MTTHNGWTNHKTWLASLWLTDTREMQTFKYLAEELVQTRAKTEAVLELASKIEDYLADRADTEAAESGLFRELLFAALEEINCQEIASHVIDEVYEDAEC